MHMVNLGLWVHLVSAVFFDLKEYLERAKRPQSGTNFFGAEAMLEICNRYIVLIFNALCVDFTDFNCLSRVRDRLTDNDLGIAGYKIDKHVASIAHTTMDSIKDSDKSTLGLKATEHYDLMMVILLCFYKF